jgi:4-amino-4-deoxy-L-arabinose transferase-like glycosyltransferase
VRLPARLRGRSFAFWLTVIAVAAAVVRILQTLLIAPWPPGIFNDEAYYITLGKVVAHGHGFIRLDEFYGHHRSVPTAERAPLYPLALAGLTKLGLGAQEWQRLLSTVTGVGTVVFAGLIGRRLAGERAGLLSAAVAAAYPTLIAADGALMTESLYGFLGAAALFAALRLRDVLSWRRAALVGGLAGLAALARSDALVLLVLLLVPLLRLRGGLRVALVAAVAALVVLAPWTIRNYHVFHRPVLIATEGGETLRGANCQPAYHGKNIGSWQSGCVHFGGTGNEAKELDKLGHQGVSYAAHHATRVPLVLVARLARTWGVWPFFQVPEGRKAWVMHIGVVVFFLLLPFAVLGLLELRRRRAPTWVIVTPFVMVTISTLLSYGSLRFRHLAEISLVVLAGVGIEAWLTRRRGPPARPPAPAT